MDQMKATTAISLGTSMPTFSIFLEAFLEVIQVGIMILGDLFSNGSKILVE